MILTKNVAIPKEGSKFWYRPKQKQVVGRSNKFVDGTFSKLQNSTNSAFKAG